MRAADLDIHELLHFFPEGELIAFAGERVLLLDAVALGLMRKELIDLLGLTSPGEVLTRFGYAHRTFASPKHSTRDSRGTAKTSGERPARGSIRFRASFARR